jgi:hypothetical protein
MRKHFSTLYFIFTALIVLTGSSVFAQTATVAQSITGKTICGYQGWFNCYGDGSPVARWAHWSGGTYQSNAGAPAPGAITFEAYPAVDEYNPSSLFQTNLGTLGDGVSSAELFSSYKADIIDQHFAWMQQNGIDGVALQRFISETFDGVFKANRDSVTARVKRSAEAHQRVFYLMYDISGLDTAKFDSIKTDWQNNMVNALHITSSPYYVHQNNKPVVCLWGFGFTDRPGNVAQCLDVINWFKSNGCFVIGGVPTYWRTSTNDSKPNFINVYNDFDMLSPWTVGRFSDSTGTDNYKTNLLVPDAAYCNTNNILYQPVAFPGFSWSNWNGGTQNQIPRNKGEFLWRQVYNIKQSNIGNMYVAMFDEFDEGTAITKMADSYYSIPNNQYFLTTSADGTYLSSDFYLRLVGKATKAINGTESVTKYVSIPYSNGPIWFRSGFEQKYDAAPNWTDSPDTSVAVSNVIGYEGTGNPECGVVSEINHIGTYSLRYAGRDNSTTSSSIYFRVFNVNIPVDPTTVLSFWTYPQTDISRYTSVDLIMSDGTTLRNSGATDINGISMNPSAGRGLLNTWQQTTSDIGLWLNGKTIVRILVGYDHAAETGDFRGYIDDIELNENPNIVVALTLVQFNAEVNNGAANLQWTTENEINASKIIVEKSSDGITFTSIATVPAKNLSGINNYQYTDNDLSSNNNEVFYRLKFTDNNGSYKYSNVIALLLSTNINGIKVLPNPAKSYVQVSITSKTNETATIKITDASGKAIITQPASISKGLNIFIVNGLDKFSNGFYIVQLINNEEILSSSLIIE